MFKNIFCHFKNLLKTALTDINFTSLYFQKKLSLKTKKPAIGGCLGYPGITKTNFYGTKKTDFSDFKGTTTKLMPFYGVKPKSTKVNIRFSKVSQTCLNVLSSGRGRG